MLRLLGRISSGEEGKETKILGKEIKILKKRGWGKNIKLKGIFYSPGLLGNVGWCCEGKETDIFEEENQD